MRVLFAVGLLCVFIVFFDRFKSAFSGRLIDIFLAVELGLMLALFVIIKFHNATSLRVTFVVLSLINAFYFVYSGAVHPLGGLLYSVINAVLYMLLFGLPMIWVYKSAKPHRKKLNKFGTD